MRVRNCTKVAPSGKRLLAGCGKSEKREECRSSDQQWFANLCSHVMVFEPNVVPIPLVESALLPSAIEGSCDLSPIVNLIFLIYLPFIAPV